MKVCNNITCYFSLLLILLLLFICSDQVIKSTHHPFTAPVQQHLHKLYTATSIEDLNKVRYNDTSRCG